MLHREQQTVVIRCRAVVQLSDDSEVLTLILILQVQCAPRVVIATRGVRRDDDRIDIRARPQMNRGCAEIIPSHQPVRSDLFLKTEVPLMHIWILHGLRIHRIGSTEGKQRIAQTDWKWIASRRSGPRVIEAAWRRRELQTACVRRIYQDRTGFLCVRQLIETCVGCPYGHPPVPFWIPCQTESWSPLVPSVVPILETRHAGIAGKPKARRSRWVGRAVYATIEGRFIEECGVSAQVRRRLIWLPSQSCVDSQPRRRLPRVLHVQAEIFLTLVNDARRRLQH